MAYSSLVSSLVLVGFLGILYAVIRPRKLSPNEPPLIPSRIPFLGHGLGMLFDGGRYFRVLAQRYPQYSIFTLPAGPGRIYAVTSPRMAMEIQRKQKTLQFDPLVPYVLPRIMGMNSKAVAILQNNATKEAGNFGALFDIREAMTLVLGTGSALDDLLLSLMKELQAELIDIPTGKVDLLGWTAHAFTLATARALYGPRNPIAVHPSLEADYWTFDRGLGPLLIGFLPSLTAPGPYHARERCVQGYYEYLQDETNKAEAAEVVQRRFQVLEKNGFDLDGWARSELTFLFAGVGNTTITAFWLVLRIFADPELLADVRKEIQQTGIDPSALRAGAPLLNSALSESLRIGSDTNSLRLVLTDTTVLDKETGTTYMLHANSVVQIATAAIHADPRLWDDASAFNPRRFMDVKAPAGLRPFGGGATLCPGRHLASGTVLTWAAMVISQLDISPASGERLVVPEKDDRRLPVHICEPKERVFVKIEKVKQ